MPVVELDMIMGFVNTLDALHEVAGQLFRRIKGGDLKDVYVASSAYLEYELLLRSRGYGEAEIREDLRAFREYPNLREAPLIIDVMILASDLRERYDLTYFDSLHAASALTLNEKIVSVDEAYDGVDELERVDPADL
ncbi:MAG: type II toxin-antitoxin system VapC family toxin [Candidatus Geothermarchaeales archaeon]